MLVCLQMSQLPPEFDDYQPTSYDPQFTADISMQMNVPDRIEVASSSDANILRPHTDTHAHIDHMAVPDKIIVLGMLSVILCNLFDFDDN